VPSAQIFQAVQGGAAGVSEPVWGLAIPGQQFTDGSVVWVCIGSYQELGLPPVIALPLDSDPNLVQAFNAALQTLADFIAAIGGLVGNLLSSNNTWSGTNTYDSNIYMNSGAEIVSGTSLSTGYALMYQWNSSAGIVRFYMQFAPPSSDQSGLVLTVNAAWNQGTLQWAVDSGSFASGKFLFAANSGVAIYWLTAGSSSPFVDAAWPATFEAKGSGGNLSILGGTTTDAGSLGGAPIVLATCYETTVTSGTALVSTPGAGNAYASSGDIRLSCGAREVGTSPTPPTVNVTFNGGTTISTIPMTSLGNDGTYSYYNFTGVFAKAINNTIALFGNAGSATTIMSATAEFM